MSKRDFEAIAEVLNANIAPLELVSDLADMCEENNERFDRRLFIIASTVNLRDRQERAARALDKMTTVKAS